MYNKNLRPEFVYIHTVYVHQQSAILSLQYDNHMIVTVSTDNSFREWEWQKRGIKDGKKKSKVKKKMHMVEPGETLKGLEKRYNTKVGLCFCFWCAVCFVCFVCNLCVFLFFCSLFICLLACAVCFFVQSVFLFALFYCFTE